VFSVERGCCLMSWQWFSLASYIERRIYMLSFIFPFCILLYIWVETIQLSSFNIFVFLIKKRVIYISLINLWFKHNMLHIIRVDNISKRSKCKFIKDFKKIEYKQILTRISISALLFFSYNNLVGLKCHFIPTFSNNITKLNFLIEYTYTMSRKVRVFIDARFRITFLKPELF